MIDFGVPPPPPDEMVYVDRPVMMFGGSGLRAAAAAAGAFPAAAAARIRRPAAAAAAARAFRVCRFRLRRASCRPSFGRRRGRCRAQPPAGAPTGPGGRRGIPRVFAAAVSPCGDGVAGCRRALPEPVPALARRRHWHPGRPPPGTPGRSGGASWRRRTAATSGAAAAPASAVANRHRHRRTRPAAAPAIDEAACIPARRRIRAPHRANAGLSMKPAPPPPHPRPTPAFAKPAPPPPPPHPSGQRRPLKSRCHRHRTGAGNGEAVDSAATPAASGSRRLWRNPRPLRRRPRHTRRRQRTGLPAGQEPDAARLQVNGGE